MDKINATVFLTVAEAGSFRKAAEQLGYTQAGISYIIAAMEEETGLNLFSREHGGVTLSPEGQAILPQMRQLEQAERRLQQTVDEINGLQKGTVRVQIFDSISIHWIPGIVQKFHADFPGINIELISEEDSARAEQMVLTGEVDCGFFLTDVAARLDVFTLMEENLLAVLPPEHPISELERFPVTKLGSYPYISMKYDAHTGIMNIFRRQGIEPVIAYCMDNDYAALSMVNNGLGYGIFPELLLKEAPFDLCTKEFDIPQRRTIRIGTRSMASCTRACRKFIEYTRAWVKENT